MGNSRRPATAAPPAPTPSSLVPVSPPLSLPPPTRHRLLCSLIYLSITPPPKGNSRCPTPAAAAVVPAWDLVVGFAKLQGEDFEYYMQTYSIILARHSRKKHQHGDTSPDDVDVDLGILGSFAGLGFLSWYLAKKIKVFDRGGHVAKLCIVLLPLLLAVMVGVSRSPWRRGRRCGTSQARRFRRDESHNGACKARQRCDASHGGARLSALTESRAWHKPGLKPRAVSRRARVIFFIIHNNTRALNYINRNVVWQLDVLHAHSYLDIGMIYMVYLLSRTWKVLAMVVAVWKILQKPLQSYLIVCQRWCIFRLCTWLFAPNDYCYDPYL